MLNDSRVLCAGTCSLCSYNSFLFVQVYPLHLTTVSARFIPAGDCIVYRVTATASPFPSNVVEEGPRVCPSLDAAEDYRYKAGMEEDLA